MTLQEGAGVFSKSAKKQHLPDHKAKAAKEHLAKIAKAIKAKG